MDERLKNRWILPWRLIKRKYLSSDPLYLVMEEMKMMRSMHGIWRSWHTFGEYSNEPIDITRVMLMCLIHDVVEIDAGDTYAYDEEGKKTQKEREEAAKRNGSILCFPEDQKKELSAIFDEFEESKTPEAKFAHAMDNLQPLMLNNSNGGGTGENME